MTGPRLAADVLADNGVWDGHDASLALLAGADMVALVRTDADVEVRGLEAITERVRDVDGKWLTDAYRLVDAPVPADTQEADRVHNETRRWRYPDA